MNFFRHHILSKSLLWMLTLHLFNVSVDPPDKEMFGVAEDLSINDMESVMEIIIEDFMGINNFFPEHDEDDSKSHRVYIDIDFFEKIKIFSLTLSKDISDKNKFDTDSSFFSDIQINLVSPPPELTA